MANLTDKQAYLAMFSFLEEYYHRTKSEEIGGLLGGMALMADGKPTDAAVAGDWAAAVSRATGGAVDARLKLGR